MLQEAQERVLSKPPVFRLPADHWRTLRDLRLRALEDSPDSFLGTVAEEQGYGPELWRDELDCNDWFVATLGAEPIGLAKLNRTEDSYGRLHLEALWVAPAARGKGVGRALVSAVEDAAAALGLQQIRLWIFIKNRRACDFYLCLGYRPLRTQPVRANGCLTFESEYQKDLKPNDTWEFEHGTIPASPGGRW